MEKNGLHAIVIDDDDLIRDLLRRLLERRGYIVTMCERPTFCQKRKCEQLDKCADLIISDIEMSGGNGMKLAEQQEKKCCKVPHHALMSGSWSYEHIVRANELGRKILPKPFDIKELYSWLQECEEGFSEPKK